MKKSTGSWVFFAGIALFIIGVLMGILIPDAQGIMKTMPFVFIGFGAGIIAVGVVNIFNDRMRKKDTGKYREYEIAEKDERNIRLREKAGYATWFVTLFVLAALVLTLVILQQYLACYLAIGALFIHVISQLVAINAYNKRI